jgi:hypothetical protein
VHVVGTDQLCADDLAETRELSHLPDFHYDARLSNGATLPVTRRPEGGICVALAHVAPDGGSPDDARGRYVRVTIADGVARGSLVVHLYDLGPARGYRLAGLERPEP